MVYVKRGHLISMVTKCRKSDSGHPTFKNRTDSMTARDTANIIWVEKIRDVIKDPHILEVVFNFVPCRAMLFNHATLR